MIGKYKFYKDTLSNWYIEIPGWEGPDEALQMVAGADTFLDILSNNGKEVILEISDESQKNFERLFLVGEEKDMTIGGANYVLLNFKGKPYQHEMWLCDVTLFVFNGEFPHIIYFKTV